MMGYRLAILLFACLQLCLGGVEKRPFYIIAHMANSIATMDAFLRKGANGIEVDVSFDSDGTAKFAYHGVPCDRFRRCHESTLLSDYLEAAATRNITLLFMRLSSKKLNLKQKKMAGNDLASRVFSHFYVKGGRNTNIVLSVSSVTEKPVLSSYIALMEMIASKELHSKTSFDVSGKEDLADKGEMLRELNITSSWQGDGITNWFEFKRDFVKIRDFVHLRNHKDHFIKKVYRWTVDSQRNIRKTIDLGADAVITNKPTSACLVLREFKNVRLAVPEDDINGLTI